MVYFHNGFGYAPYFGMFSTLFPTRPQNRQGVDLDQHFSVQNLGPRYHQPKSPFRRLETNPTDHFTHGDCLGGLGFSDPWGLSRVFLGSAEDFIHSFGFSHSDVQVAGWSKSCDG